MKMYPRAKHRRYLKPPRPRKSGAVVCYPPHIKRIEENWKASQKRVEPFLKKLTELVSSRNRAVFTIKTKESNFKVHKYILSMHSPVFKNMFQQEKCADSVKVEDCSPAVVQELIDFMYTGDLEDSENPMELYELAKTYEVKELQSICEEIILEDLKKSNCLEVFCFGLNHDNVKLKIRAFKAIKKLFPDKKLNEKLFSNPWKLNALIKVKKDLDTVLADLEASESDSSVVESDSGASYSEHCSDSEINSDTD